jgi:hemolysin III
LLIAETVMAITGIVAVSCWGGGPKWLRLVLYLGMGWLAVIALRPLFASLGWQGVAWLLAGGLAYSVGTVFYATKWPKMWPGVFSSHELWHLFVLAGSACHFAVMLRIERLPLP